MRDAQPKAIRLQDYQPPAYLVEQVELRFELHEEYALVHSQLRLRRNDSCAPGAPLVLDGVGLELLSISLDGRALATAEYAVSDAALEIAAVPDSFLLECSTRIYPQDNTALEGLYKSEEMFCTQCEAHGFRKITYYPDRPDVMSVFRVTVEADKARYPVLLSNGNPLSSQDLPDGRHSACWHDPFPKPAYLFALVAGETGISGFRSGIGTVLQADGKKPITTNKCVFRVITGSTTIFRTIYHHYSDIGLCRISYRLEILSG